MVYLFIFSASVIHFFAYLSIFIFTFAQYECFSWIGLRFFNASHGSSILRMRRTRVGFRSYEGETQLMDRPLGHAGAGAELLQVIFVGDRKTGSLLQWREGTVGPHFSCNGYVV